jgi:hypothetical protein
MFGQDHENAYSFAITVTMSGSADLERSFVAELPACAGFPDFSGVTSPAMLTPTKMVSRASFQHFMPPSIV